MFEGGGQPISGAGGTSYQVDYPYKLAGPNTATSVYGPDNLGGGGQPFGERCKDVVVVARLSERRREPVHRGDNEFERGITRTRAEATRR